MRYAVAITIFFLSIFQCRARLGDDPAESAAKYGQPISHGSGKGKGNETGLDWCAYAQGGFKHEIHFYNGRAVLEIIWKLQQPDTPSARAPFSEQEKQKFLKENSEGLNWSNPMVVGKDHPGEEAWIWTRTDKATAMYSQIDHEFHFSTYRWR